MKINNAFSNDCYAKNIHRLRIFSIIDGLLNMDRRSSWFAEAQNGWRESRFQDAKLENYRFCMKQQVGRIKNAWYTAPCGRYLKLQYRVWKWKLLFLMPSRLRIRKHASLSNFFVKLFGKRVSLASQYHYNHWSANFSHQPHSAVRCIAGKIVNSVCIMKLITFSFSQLSNFLVNWE